MDKLCRINLQPIKMMCNHPETLPSLNRPFFFFEISIGRTWSDSLTWKHLELKCPLQQINTHSMFWSVPQTLSVLLPFLQVVINFFLLLLNTARKYKFIVTPTVTCFICASFTAASLFNCSCIFWRARSIALFLSKAKSWLTSPVKQKCHGIHKWRTIINFPIQEEL